MKPSIFKKMVSIILSCAMCFPMFSTNIFANTNDVVSGYYDNNGNWEQGELVQTLPEGINSINKSATKIEKNKYKINLKVVTEQNKVTSSKEAATVLVIDTSGSMKDESRMANAKKAAKDFIDTYAGKEVASGRYVAVVDFATEGKVALGWTDVATENGKKAAKNAVDALRANGGTNLHAGLKYASTLLSSSKVNEIDFKNSIILTDGAPTYYLDECDNWFCIRKHIKIGDTKYHIEGKGNSGSKTTNEVTATEATTLRSKSKVYTVCYGAGNDKTYKNGPTVGEFLEGSIASKNCAYNVDNASELNEIFENITNTIISGIDGKELEVVDKLTEFISVSGLPTNITSDGSGFTWKLSDTKPTISTNGNKTIYTYELEYIVTIDADNAKFEEGKYYPLNGDTYIMVNGQKVKFPIPAAKGEKTMCTVTYTDGVNEDVVFEEQSKTVKIGEKTPEFTGKLERKGYVFVGWSPKVEETVTKDVIYVAQWEKDENGNGVPDKNEDLFYTIKYEDGVEAEKLFDVKFEKVEYGKPTPNFTGKLERKGYVFAGWNPKVSETVTGNATYVATWDRDENENGVPDKKETKYKVVYTDGVENEVVFENQENEVLKGLKTPEFKGGKPKRKGYIFAGWSPEVSKTVERNAVYTALWDKDANGNNVPDKEEKYTVTYTDGVEEELFNVQFKDLEYGTSTPNFTGKLERKGYVFAGWSPEVSKTVERNAVYTALWDRDINGNGKPDKDEDLLFTVTYDDGLNEDFFNVKFENVEYGTSTPKFTGNLNVKGYVFVGWEPKVSETVTGNATYVAQWEKDANGNGIPDKNEKRYTVTYTDGVENEVVFKDEVTTGLFVGDLTPEFKQGGEKGIPTRTGYVFMGWSPKPSYIIKAEEKEQIVYTATWEVDKNGDNRPDKDQPYKITYTDGVEGKEVFADQVSEALYGDITPVFNGTPTRSGYKFKGWEPKVADTVTGDATYVAQWEKEYVAPPTPPTPPVKPDGGDGDRIEGHDRIETAIEASKDLYPGGTNAVVLANCERYTDVLTANPFAVQEKASVLFTYLDKLPEKTLREIERLGVKKIYISGGYEAVSKKVVDQLRDRGYEIYRFDGENRYDTARKIAIKMREKGNTKVVELASGENYPDALSMTSMAVKDNAPILLTKKDSIPMYTKKALAEWDIETVKIAGLNEAISKEVEKQIDKGFSIVKGNKEDSNIYDGALSVLRYGGANRYETSTVIAAATYPESRTGVYATGENFPDALVAGNYAGIKKAPVLLVKRDSLPSVVKQYNENSNIRRAVVVGGVNAISDYVFDLIKLSIK